jgi:hypothetical protein
VSGADPIAGPIYARASEETVMLIERITNIWTQIASKAPAPWGAPPRLQAESGGSILDLSPKVGDGGDETQTEPYVHFSC